MIIDLDYRVEACAAQDDMQPILTYVSVGTFRGRDVAVAADGFHLAVVPIEFEDGDVPGVVPAALFEQARVWTHKAACEARVRLEADRVVFQNGWTAPRPPSPGAFPSVEKIVEAALTENERAEQFAVNPRLLANLQKALGGPGLILHWSTTRTPILVCPLGGIPDSERLEPPFGIVMPMYSAATENGRRPGALRAP